MITLMSSRMWTLRWKQVLQIPLGVKGVEGCRADSVKLVVAFGRHHGNQLLASGPT